MPRGQFGSPGHFTGERSRKPCGRKKRVMATETFLAVPAVRKNGTRVSIEFTIFPYRNREGNLISNRGHRALRHEALRRNAGAAQDAGLTTGP